jgi:DNA-binding GntR family transcriptional regulator
MEETGSRLMKQPKQISASAWSSPRLIKGNASSSASSVPAQASLSSHAYFLVRERILRGQLRPGDVISRRKVAQDLGISLLPVAEAFKRLESDHLVECRPRAGTRVRIPSLEEIQGRCIVREALESQSARLCSLHATTKQRLELERMAEQLDTLYFRFQNAPDPDLQFVVHTNHFELHMRIAEYAGSPELREAIERNNVLIHNWFFDLAAERTSLPAGFHRKLVKVIAAGDPEAADAAMRRHVQYGLPAVDGRGSNWPRNDWRLPRRRGAT